MTSVIDLEIGNKIHVPLVIEAIDVMMEAHEGQTRKDGVTPFVNHPIQVTNYVYSLGFQDHCAYLIPALLHDVLEDTDYPYRKIYKKFGLTIAAYVDFLSKTEGPFSHKRYVAKLVYSPRNIKNIKFADIMMNLADLEVCDQPFRTFFVNRAEEYAKTVFEDFTFHLVQKLVRQIDSVRDTYGLPIPKETQ